MNLTDVDRTRLRARLRVAIRRWRDKRGTRALYESLASSAIKFFEELRHDPYTTDEDANDRYKNDAGFRLLADSVMAITTTLDFGFTRDDLLDLADLLCPAKQVRDPVVVICAGCGIEFVANVDKKKRLRSGEKTVYCTRSCCNLAKLRNRDPVTGRMVKAGEKNFAGRLTEENRMVI